MFYTSHELEKKAKELAATRTKYIDWIGWGVFIEKEKTFLTIFTCSKCSKNETKHDEFSEELK